MSLILSMTIAYLAGALCALFPRSPLSRWGTAGCAALGGTFATIAASKVILSGVPFSFAVLPGQLLLPLSFRLDGLGAVFLLLIGLSSIPIAIYAAGYFHRGHDRAFMVCGSLLNLFFLTMSLVVCANDVLTFLLLWESMSLASYFLIISEDQGGETISAGAWYAGMAHLGFALILAALMLAGKGIGTLSFDDIRSLAQSHSPALKGAVFILALLGFGSKAGLVPLHVWLPKAHPAAPSPVSAAMSGVMVKLGIYGILRVSMDLLASPPPWWGGLVLMLGAVSAMLGVLYALMEHDLKRLLAHHTVENVGLISMGVGLALLFRSYGLGSLAALALVAALYHTLNHGAFKGLLFLGAGSVLHATGTRNMEKMGGLIRRMPVTAACFLVGAAAISGLPPLNGFVSEWLLFQSLIAGVKIPAPLVHAMMALAIGALALTAGLAAACFVKAFGISFLAIPRSVEAEHAHEAPATMRFGMLFLVMLCVLLGILPFLVTPFLSRAIAGLPGVDAAAVRFHFGLLLEAPGQVARISPTALALLLAAVIGAIPLVLRLAGTNQKLRFVESWGCGRIGQSPRMEYTSSAFAEPLRRVFGALYRPTQDVMIDYHPESKYFIQSILYRSEVRTWFEGYLYRPLMILTARIGSSGRWIQSGSIHWYIGYIFLALLVFLLLARWM
jgi:hydrogenase-4 component B